MTTTTDRVARSAGGPSHLPNSLSDFLLGAHDLFWRTLETVSSFNPFHNPANPPGTRARDVERRLLWRIPTRVGFDAPSRETDILFQERLCALKQVLSRSTLLRHERSAVLAAVAGFLRPPDLAGPEPCPPPCLARADHLLFLDSLRRTLAEDCLLPAPEVRQLLQELRALTCCSAK